MHGLRSRRWRLLPAFAGFLFQWTAIQTLEADVPADRPLIAAHRGTTTGAPENTLAAIRWAATAGVDLVEVDVRSTADGELVLMHDEQVSRTTDGVGRVGALTLPQLKRFDAGQGERVPTLDEAMLLLSDHPQDLLLDVKSGDADLAGRLVQRVVAHGFQQRVLIGVRSVALLREFRGLNPDVKILAMVPNTEGITEFLEQGPDAVRLWARWAMSDRTLAERVRAAGAKVWITAGDRKADYLADLFPQVDGFITDDPLGLRRFAERHPLPGTGSHVAER